MEEKNNKKQNKMKLNKKKKKTERQKKELGQDYMCYNNEERAESL